MIYINQVLQSLENSTRIRIVEIEDSYVYIVNIDAYTSMPQKELYSTLMTDLEQNKLIIVADPFVRVVVEGDLTETQIEKRDKDWKIIQTNCLKHLKSLLQKKGREKNN